jgi:hypothetical protein
MFVGSCVYLPCREIHGIRKVRSFFCTVKLQITIDDDADTKQKQLIKISAIHDLSWSH